MERRSSPPARAPRAVPWAGIGLTLAAVALLAIAVATIEPLRDAFTDVVSGDVEALREDLRRGSSGIAILLALILVHTFVWYPAEILDAAAGYVFDFRIALALVMAGWVAQGSLAYWIGRKAARPLLYRFIGERRFRRAERLIDGGGAVLLLAARLIPIVPFSLFSYVAGAVRVPFGRFVWTTAVGYLPLTALFIYYGTRLEAVGLADPVVWGGTLLLLTLLLVVHRLRLLVGHDEDDDGSSDRG